MSVKIIGLSTDYTINVTEVTIQLTENVGRIVRITDQLVVPLPGRYESVDEEMTDALFAELEANGISVYPDIEEASEADV